MKTDSVMFELYNIVYLLMSWCLSCLFSLIVSVQLWSEKPYKVCVKRNFQSTCNCNSCLIILCLMGASLQGQSVDGKLETSQSSRRFSTRPRRSASSSGSGEGRWVWGRAERRAPPRKARSEADTVGLGSSAWLEPEPGEYVCPGSKLHLPSQPPPPPGRGVKDRLGSREEARDEQPSQSGKLGPLSFGPVGGVLGQGLRGVHEYIPRPQSRGIERNYS